MSEEFGIEQNPTPRTEERIYVDEKILEARTGIPRKGWQKMRWAMKGPPWSKRGKRVLYNWDEVRAWIDAGKVVTRG